MIRVMLLALLAASAQAAVIHVDALAPSGGNGTSWVSAHNDLTAALAVAFDGDEIRLRGGTYLPRSGYPLAPQASTFRIERSLTLVGGYPPAGETDPNHPDPTRYRTVFSGDLAGDDIHGNYRRSENAFHVVTVANGVTASISGCVIRGGNAGSPYDPIQPAVADQEEGGGILCSGDLLLRECRLEDNVARNGGGVSLRWSVIPARLRAVGCTWIGNRAENTGGAIAAEGSSVILEACRFLGNQAGAGGALRSFRGQLTLGNCVLSGNRATEGAAVLLLGGISRFSTCTFASNASIWNGAVTAFFGTDLMVEDSIFWGNTARSGSLTNAQVSADVGSSIRRCSISGGVGSLPAQESGEWAPRFVSPLGLDGVAGTEDDDLRMYGISECVDRGSAGALPPDRFDRDGDGNTGEAVPLDLAGNLRVQPLQVGLAAALDLGAYEGAQFGVEWSPRTLAVPEGGSAVASLQVLGPLAAPITITLLRLSGDGDISCAPTIIVQPDRWRELHQVTITAAADADYHSSRATIAARLPGGESGQMTISEIDDDIPPARLYVDGRATGAGTGVSWEDAMADLQTALAGAAVHAAVQEVWIASGTYRPGIQDDGARASFRIRTALVVRGGFTGTESDPAQRPLTGAAVVLSGDNDQDDLAGVTTDNALHVVRMDACDAVTLLERVEITGGRAGSFMGSGPTGSGILIVGGSPWLRQVRLHDLVGEAVGVWNGASPTFDHCAIADNDTGVRAIPGTRTRFLSCSITGSRTSALYVAEAYFSDGVISGNASGMLAEKATIERTRFVGNRSLALDLRGGSDAGSSRVSDCEFTDNQAPATAIQAGNLTLLVERCRFLRNGVAGMFGSTSVCRMSNTALTLRDCEFSQEDGRISGSAVEAYEGNIRIEGCRFVNLVCTVATINIRSANVLLTDNVLVGCETRGSGGSILFLNNCTAHLVASRFIGNRTMGGTLDILGGSASLAGCVFAANTMRTSFAQSEPVDGSAINLDSAAVSVSNCTIDHSRPGSQQSAIRQYSGSLVLANSILVSSTEPALTQERFLVKLGGTVAVSRCLVQGWDGTLPGTDTIGGQPGFAAMGGPDGLAGTADDDLRLAPDSIALDAGITPLIAADFADRDGDGDVSESDPWDITGAARIAGSTVDLGAYEGGVPSVVIEPGICAVPEGGSAVVSVRLSAQPTVPVSVSLNLRGDPDLSLAVATTVTFTPTDWANPRQVTLIAGQDGDIRTGVATLSATGLGVAAGAATVREIDDEPAPSRLYVDLTATGTGIGTSWTNACTDLAVALAIAAERPSVERIWIADGVYRPAAIGGDIGATYRVRGGLALIGGFAGGETSEDGRDPATHRVLLNGDIDRNDDPAVKASYFENTTHLVTVVDPTGDVLIDGLALSGGRAERTVTTTRASGGGILCESGSLTVRNCSFEGSWSSYGGSAIYSGGPLRLERCRFRDENNADGGAVDAVGPLECVRCDFLACRGWEGSALRLGALANGFHRVVNCRFLGCQGIWGTVATRGPIRMFNSVVSGNHGTIVGGIYMTGSYLGPQSRALVNCTISNNTSTDGMTAGIDMRTIDDSYLSGCIVWGNAVAGRPRDLLAQMNFGSGMIARNSCVEGWGTAAPGSGMIAVDPRLSHLTGADGATATSGEVATLEWNSPCIDAGHIAPGPDYFDLDGDGVVTEEVPLDLAGRPRRHDHPLIVDRGFGTAPIIDMGAYEVQSSAQPPLNLVLSPAVVTRRAPAATVVGMLTASDPDPGDRHVFTLVAGPGDADNARFTITGATVTCSQRVALAGMRSIRVRAVDRDGLAREQALAVTVLEARAAILSIDSTTPPGIYRRGDSITVKLAFDHPATLGAGVLRVTFDTGATLDLPPFARVMNVSGVHVVGPGERSSDLTVGTVQAIGAALVDDDEVPFALDVPTPSFADLEAIALITGRRIDVRVMDAAGPRVVDGIAIQLTTTVVGTAIGSALRFDGLATDKDVAFELETVPSVRE